MEKKVLYTIELEGNDALLAEMAKLRQANDSLKKENQEYNKSLKEGKKVSDDQAKAYERNTAQIKANNKSLGELNKEIQNGGKVVVGTRKELTELRRRMQEMSDAGEHGSKQFVELRNRASELQDSIDRVSNEIKVFADDAIVINTVVDSAKALASGFQLVQSAQALLGFESEKFEEVMQKLIATQTLVNSLQQVSNALQKQSRLVILGKVAAVKIATAAQKVWNVVMTANPIGLVITAIAALGAGIYALIKNFDKVVEAIKKAWKWLSFWKKSTDEVSESVETAEERVERLTAANERATKVLGRKNDALEFEIKLLKALGAEEDVILKKERELLLQRIEEAKLFSERVRLQEGFSDAWRESRDRIIEAERQLQLFDAAEKRRQTERVEKEREANRLLAIEENKRAKERYDRDKLAEAELYLLRTNSLDARLQLERIKHSQRMAEKSMTHAEAELAEYLHQQRMKQIENEAFDEAMGEDTVKFDEKQEKEAEERQKELDAFNAWWQERNGVKEDQFALEQQQLDKWREMGLITETAYAEAVMDLNERMAESQTALAKERSDAEMETAMKLIDSLNLQGEAKTAFAKFSQFLAIAEIAMSIQKAYAATMAVGFPKNIPMLIGLAAQTIGLISKVRNLVIPSPPKMEKGGTIIGGKSHSAGGTNFVGSDGTRFEAEKGEYLAVVNKKDAARAAMLDSINQRHGDAFGIKASNYFARGGVIMPQPRQDFEDVNMSDTIREMVEQIGMIPVVVAERDITQTQENVRKITVAGDLV